MNPTYLVRLKEAKDALKTADDFVRKVSQLIREKAPQQDFKFKEN